MNLQSYITEIVPEKGFYTFTPFSDTYLLDKRQITECETRLDDGRTISADQRKKIYATLRDISIYTGHEIEDLKNYFKVEYIIRTGGDWFSLSNTDMTTANEFLSLLIGYCIEWDIPCAGTLLERSPDTSRYLYSCLVHKRCAICGTKAELHHMDAVGAGRNRKEILHYGMRAIALCRTHHIEVHNIGKRTFKDKYHVYGIKLDHYLCKILKLGGKK